MLKTFTFCILFLSLNTYAVEPVPYGFSEEANQEMAEKNRLLAQLQTSGSFLFSDITDPRTFNLLQTTSVRAFAEYEQAGYLIFSDAFHFSSKKAKLAMAENLPQDMELVIFTNSSSEGRANQIRSTFESVIESERLKIVYMPRAERGFWARDGVPVPVFRSPLDKIQEETFSLVDAPYYHRFEADREFADLFETDLTRHEYFYEGGNFITNSKNECLIVDKKATRIIPDFIFKDHYGCNVLTRLPHVKGIGHADETVKFIDDTTVLTDEESYVSLLEDKGYQVVMIPEAALKYETYVNSLVVNGTVYVPIFNESTDEEALDVYRSLGFSKVIGINTKTLSTKGAGSLHCITMTYPPVRMSKLLQSMGGSIL